MTRILGFVASIKRRDRRMCVRGLKVIDNRKKNGKLEFGVWNRWLIDVEDEVLKAGLKGFIALCLQIGYRRLRNLDFMIHDVFFEKTFWPFLYFDALGLFIRDSCLVVVSHHLLLVGVIPFVVSFLLLLLHVLVLKPGHFIGLLFK